MIEFSWTEEAIKTMREMCEAGHTARQVAEALKCSRNAVIGKASREGLRFGMKRKVAAKEPEVCRGYFIWTLASRTYLRQRIEAGDTSAVIAKEMTRLFARGGKSVSDKAVRAEASRLGITRPKRVVARPAPVIKPKLIESPAPPVDAVIVGVTLMQLTSRSCRWPIGDVGEPSFRFCGAERKGEGSYCKGHAALAYVPSKKRGPASDHQKAQARKAMLKLWSSVESRNWMALKSA